MERIDAPLETAKAALMNRDFEAVRDLRHTDVGIGQQRLGGLLTRGSSAIARLFIDDQLFRSGTVRNDFHCPPGR